MSTLRQVRVWLRASMCASMFEYIPQQPGRHPANRRIDADPLLNSIDIE